MKAVVGIDGSENSFDAIVQACRMLDPERDCLALYCAMPHVQVGIPAAHDVAERGRAKLSQSILARAALHVPEAWKGRFQRIVGADDPSRGILNTAQELAADLIVVGTHGLGGLGRLLVGSVSRKVVHGATAPVMVVRKRSRAKERAGLHVLLACESLETGRQLSTVLSRFTWPSGTVAEVVHIAPSIFGGAIPAWLDAEARCPDVEETVKLWVRDHDNRLATARAEMQTLCGEHPSRFQTPPPTVVEGAPDMEILKVAQRQSSDLVVIGAKTSTPLGRLVGRSTCESVLNHAPCSVLVIPHA
jgi:nucleotide-binding universal stress UspA family protein